MVNIFTKSNTAKLKLLSVLRQIGFQDFSVGETKTHFWNGKIGLEI